MTRQGSSASWLPAILMLVGVGSSGASILDTKHNLSVTGSGPVRSSTEEEVCVFCHAPHNYQTYDSSTLRAAPGQPSGASKLCLSCHDGTIALGAVWNRKEEIPFVGDIRLMPDGKGKLGTDLSDDHPVSIEYQKSAQPRTEGIRSAGRFESSRKPGQKLGPVELRPNSTLPSEIQIDPSGQIQCTSCHDPHEDINGSFLVLPLEGSTLCLACHEPLRWEMSSHAISGAKWNGAPPSPWPGSRYATVAANA